MRAHIYQRNAGRLRRPSDEIYRAVFGGDWEKNLATDWR